MAQVSDVLEETRTVDSAASYADQAKAKMLAVNVGCATIHADAGGGKFLAVTIVGPAAEHGAHLLALAIHKDLTTGEPLAMRLYHPLYEEGLQPALRKICKTVDTSPYNRDGIMPGSEFSPALHLPMPGERRRGP